MAHHVVYETETDLKYELKKCKECSCSRCSLNGTPDCYIEVAIKEIERYEHAMAASEVARKYEKSTTGLDF